MRAESAALSAEIRQVLDVLRARLDWPTLEPRLAALEAQAEDPDLWKDPERARSVLRARQRLVRAREGFMALERELEDLEALAILAAEESEEEFAAEAETGLTALRAVARERELEALLSGEADGNDAFLEVNAGAGGTDACHWAEMLLRMYRRWAQAQGYEVQDISVSPGEEAGLRSAMIQVVGEDAFGWLKAESGVHRLVRISPFDSQHRRHTAFASVSAAPVVDDTIEIDIPDRDIRIDTFRASGSGGQHVNKTDSAVRITHLPTGTVAVSSEKSQHMNRAQAMKVLRSRLYEMEMQKREDARREAEAEKKEIGWGSQIRSYVLYPYQMVKDVRTGVTSSDVNAVLDGALGEFMAAELERRVRGDGSANETEDH